MANKNYMTMGLHTENGEPKTPTVKFHAERNEADYQYCLFRAAASKSNYEEDTAILMTITGEVIEKKTYKHTPVEPEGENE